MFDHLQLAETPADRLGNVYRVILVCHDIACPAQYSIAPSHVAQIRAAAAYVTRCRQELWMGLACVNTEYLNAERRIDRPRCKCARKRPLECVGPELERNILAVRREAQFGERYFRIGARDAGENGPTPERPVHVQEIKGGGWSLPRIKRARPGAAKLHSCPRQLRRSRRVDVVQLLRQRKGDRRRLACDLDTRARVGLRSIRKHQYRSCQRRERCCSIRVRTSQLDVIGVVPPDDVIERVVLRETAVSKAVVTDARRVDYADQLRTHAPGSKQIGIRADFASYRSHEIPVRLHDIQSLAIEKSCMTVVALIAQMP